MLYIKQTTSVQSVAVPRNYALPFSGATTLTLSDVMGGGDIAVSVRSLEVFDRVYKLSVKLSKKMTEGEYEYTLRIGGEIVATGLAQVGDYQAEVINYEEENDIEQYDADEM